MFRNWAAIAQLKDPLFQVFTITATDPDILRGLEKGFPMLFTEEEAERRIPWSLLDRLIKSNETATGKGGRAVAVARFLKLPIFWFGDKKYPHDCEENDVYVGPDPGKGKGWCSRGRAFTCGVQQKEQVEHLGIKYLVLVFPSSVSCWGLTPSSFILFDQ